MIVVDAMGGDRPVEPMVAAALELAREGVAITLVGDKTALRAALARRRGPAVVVEAADSPARSLSRAAAIANEAGAPVVSAAPAPETVDAAVAVRPPLVPRESLALAGVFATSRDPVTVLDLGAVTVADADTLASHAALGATYARVIARRPRPRVGVLSPRRDRVAPAQEDADALLANAGLEIEYAGRIDGTQVFAGDVDVIVTDGTTGQILVETIEGLAAAIDRQVKSFGGGLLAGAGAVVASRLSKSFGPKLRFVGAGAATILGLDGLYLVAHRRSGERMWSDALRTAEALRMSTATDDLRATAAKLRPA